MRSETQSNYLPAILLMKYVFSALPVLRKLSSLETVMISIHSTEARNCAFIDIISAIDNTDCRENKQWYMIAEAHR